MVLEGAVNVPPESVKVPLIVTMPVDPVSMVNGVVCPFSERKSCAVLLGLIGPLAKLVDTLAVLPL